MIKVSDTDIIKFCMDEKTMELGMRHLMINYKEKLYWQIKRIVEHHDDTDEVLQNVWIKIWQNIAKFKGESALTTWLYRIAYNESITYLQGKKKQNLADWELVSPVLEENVGDENIEIEGMVI
jgi:RNA polymerase sigma-70 factor (ECF subfamily)